MLEWCATSEKCEGFTTAQPPSGVVPADRLQTACYCCRVDVRTNRGQVSYTKWAMPSRRARMRLDERLTWTQEEQAKRQQPGQGPPPMAGRRGSSDAEDEMAVLERMAFPPPAPARMIRSASGKEVPAALQLALQRLAANGGLGDQVGADAPTGDANKFLADEAMGAIAPAADDGSEGGGDGVGAMPKNTMVEFEAQIGCEAAAEPNPSSLFRHTRPDGTCRVESLRSQISQARTSCTRPL